MIKYISAYAAALVLMGVIDMVWLGIMANRFYRPVFGDIALAGVNLPPAIAFYLIYPIGLTIFAVSPALKNGNIGTAVLYGALFGFFTYATYDLTNQATLRNWTLQLTLVDTAWGTLLAAMAATGSFVLASKIGA